MTTRDRVLTDPEIAAAWAKEDAALRAWASGRSVRELRRLEAAYVEAHRETSRLLRSRPRIDPLAPSAEAPS
ncbi:MAG: hypothetical protein KBB14_20485 [Thermoanaerobaculia bacterium]|nr:hypothetical protein [Thermoanaerobaculia bacterium]